MDGHRLVFSTAIAATVFRRLGMVLAVMAVSAGPLAAHDMWIEPTNFSPAAGDIIGARLRVGQNMLGDPLPRSTPLISEFIADDGHSRRPLIGRDGSDPAGLVRVAEPGLMILGYFSHPSSVELTSEKFETYLKEEGLDAVAAQWARQSHASGARELFSRCAKSLVLSGPAEAVHGDRTLGFTLELVAERNPYTIAANQDLPVRLTYKGRPLPGALVVAMDRTASSKVSARSDKDGRVRLRLTHPGMWMIKAVHMIPAAPEEKADWQSFWASLTFDLPGTPTAPRTAMR